MAGVKEILDLRKRQDEVVKKVARREISIEDALNGTQGILDGIYPFKFTPPYWYELPEVQIKTVSGFLEHNGNEIGFTVNDISAPPSDFVSRTRTEVLMLVVTLPDKGEVKLTQRNFDSKWDFIVPPEGFSKWRWDGLKSGAQFLRYVEGVCKTPGVRWVGFDPEAYIGLSPEQALEQALKDGVSLGSDDILDAAIVFPKWSKSWDGKKWHYPNMSAYQLNYNAGWRDTPCLVGCWDGVRQLRLGTRGSVNVNGSWSSPTVREL